MGIPLRPVATTDDLYLFSFANKMNSMGPEWTVRADSLRSSGPEVARRAALTVKYGGRMMSNAKPRILCVDDEPVNLKLFDAFLLPQGYDVLHAYNGRQALEMIQEQKVDLVLLDVMMPDLNGYEVCRRIKDDPVRAHIPVIMITSLQFKKERIKGIEAGAEDFINKPIDQEEVLARIRMLLKMKELNEQLGQAYASVTGLTAFAEETIKTYDPQNFDLMLHVDRLVNRIIRQTSETVDRPQILVVSVRQAVDWKWYYYESPFKELIRREFDLDAQDSLPFPGPGDSSFVYAQRSEFAAKGLEVFVSRLESHPLLMAQIKNIFCFLSSGLCVFAANYGHDVSAYDATVLNTLATQGLFFKSLADQARQGEEDVAHSVQALARAAAFHDAERGNHGLRVGEFCALLARQLGLDENFVRAIRLQSQLLDMGNIGVPVEILNKNGVPNFQEWEIIRSHVRFGAQIIGDHPRLAMAHAIALSHHENWDGSGYPDWLKGEQIPLAGRIASLADRYDSLRSARPYKAAMDHRTVCEKIIVGDERIKPEFFDPAVMQAFQTLAPQFEETFERLKD
jgi:response regulator RpfG family c-di-GMP phosphodiesterase